MPALSYLEKKLEEISKSDEFKKWLERLRPSFYDEKQNSEIINEVRSAVEVRSRGLSTEEVIKLKSAVIGNLLWLASKDAIRPPREEDELTIKDRLAEETEDLI